MAGPISFSTMWAQQPRFDDLAAFRRLVAQYGFDGIEVSHATGDAGLATLQSHGELPLTSLHAPTPMRRLLDGRVNADANLASVDEDERRLAVEETRRTLDVAARARLPLVVLHLGAVGDMPELVRGRNGWVFDAESRLIELVANGKTDAELIESTRDELRRRRAAGAEAAIDAARRSLRELVDIAAPQGIVLGLESRLHYHEIPQPAEALYLLAGYANEVAGYWHDVGHCEVQARLGMIDRGAWFPKLTPRTIGSHLHDVDGLLDHRAPGNGDVDWAYIAAGLPPTALRVFEIDQRQPDAAVAASIAFLRARGVI